MKKSLFLYLAVSLLLIIPVQAYEIKLSGSVAWQGKVITISVLSAEGAAKVNAVFLSQEVECYKKGDDFQGVIGVPIDQKTGYHDFKLIVTGKGGKQEEIIKSVKVWATKFPFSKFWLPPAKDKLRIRQIIDEEWAEIEKTLLVEDPARRWEGKFSYPLEGRISQGFGHRQIINGKRSGSHRGVDLAVFSGTKVKAPNYGKVVFAKRLKAFGGTMVLDHGQGIHTLYFHLSKLMAEAGDEVDKGAIIALSGNSGISSGAHLHWGMSVHNLRVDPIQWTKYEI